MAAAEPEKATESFKEVREQDRFLPTANISRIMKKSLPPNAKIAKDAKDTTQECVSEFISFITSEASDKCQQEKRKTINGDDLLWAMSTLGFDKYVEPLKLYLAKYRESVKGDKPVKGANSGDSKKGVVGVGSAVGDGGVMGAVAMGMVAPSMGVGAGGVVAPDLGMPSPLVSAYMPPPASSEMAEGGGAGAPMPALGLGMEPIAEAPGPSDAALPPMPS
jgi:nuclear transcription Y subunit beta